MPSYCFVNGCHNALVNGTQKSFFRIPKIQHHRGEQTRELSERRRTAWVAAINRKLEPKYGSRICSDHFISGKPADLYDMNNPDWIPTLLMSGSDRQRNVRDNDTSVNMDRYERAKRRRESKTAALAPVAERRSNEDKVEDTPVNDIHYTKVHKGSLSDTCRVRSVATQTEPFECDRVDCALIKESNDYLTVENCKLKSSVTKLSLNEKSFEGNDNKVKFMTGLPSFQTMMAVFFLVQNSITDAGKSCKISKFQKFLLCLMKIRLGCKLEDLSYRFNISLSTASRIFKSTIHILYIRLNPLIIWPDREDLRRSMPLSFREHFGVKIACIIDCFEIFIERPSGLMARAQTWSNYKHHNTIKYLIGITPQGVISFISRAWGGRVSDKYLTENSRFLENLLPGDIVLADRGFDISDSVGVMCAEVKIPSFTRGKKQLSSLDVESTRKIAHSRVHVERLIGLTRNKYTMLREIIPIDYLNVCSDGVPLIDKVVHVACALTNCCESIIPFN